MDDLDQIRSYVAWCGDKYSFPRGEGPTEERGVRPSRTIDDEFDKELEELLKGDRSKLNKKLFGHFF